MAYQARNLWLRPKPAWSRCSLYRADTTTHNTTVFVGGALSRSRDLRVADFKFLSTLFWLDQNGFS